MRCAHRDRGFTLIELLVVVAVIALLLSILLPSLSRARQQAKAAVCLSNIRTHAQATTAYLNDYEDLPWTMGLAYKTRDGYWSPFLVITEFVWGGGMPDKDNTAWAATGIDALGPQGADVSKVRPRDRALNPYISATVSWDRDPEDRYKRPADIPGFFKCPSDSSAAIPTADEANIDVDGRTPYKTWEYWGNSYAINWYWPYYYRKVPPGDAMPYNDPRRRHHLTILGAYKSPAGLGRRMIADKIHGRWASEFVIIMENRLNYAIEGAVPPGADPEDTGDGSKPKNLIGWHREWDRHVAGFLDGSGRYQKFDTRYVFGTGWTFWPMKPWDGYWAQYNANLPD